MMVFGPTSTQTSEALHILTLHNMFLYLYNDDYIHVRKCSYSWHKIYPFTSVFFFFFWINYFVLDD